jgi:3-oxoadipate enol-lactonase
VLLLHGWTASADLNWFPSYAPLGRRFHVVAMDHRGHGRGIRSMRPFRLEDCADDAAAVAAELGIDRLIAVGYSMGGPVAQLLWRRHPELVAGMVLCATSRNFTSGDSRERLLFSSLVPLSVAARVTPPAVRRRVADTLFARRLAGGPLGEWAAHELRRGDPAAVLQAGAAIGRFRSGPWIEQVDVPTAVIVTARDQVVNPERQRKLAAHIPTSTIFEVDGDHAVCVAAPQKFVPKLIQALDHTARRAGGPWTGAATLHAQPG